MGIDLQEIAEAAKEITAFIGTLPGSQRLAVEAMATFLREAYKSNQGVTAIAMALVLNEIVLENDNNQRID
jgi:hypothetical protein